MVAPFSRSRLAWDPVPDEAKWPGDRDKVKYACQEFDLVLVFARIATDDISPGRWPCSASFPRRLRDPEYCFQLTDRNRPQDPLVGTVERVQ